MTTATQRRSNLGPVVVKSGAGLVWLAGWLFTVGLVHLSGWKTFFGLFVWPYYLGTFAR